MIERRELSAPRLHPSALLSPEEKQYQSIQTAIRRMVREAWEEYTGRKKLVRAPSKQGTIENITDFIIAQLRENTLESEIHIRSVIQKKIQTILLEHGAIQNPWPFECRGQPKGPKKSANHEQQTARTALLLKAVSVAKKHSTVREKILSLTLKMFSKASPVFKWNQRGIDVPGDIPAKQMNDLVINFFFWALMEDPRFDDMARLVVYMTVFWGYAPEKIEELLKGFKKKDKEKRRKVDPDMSYLRSVEEITAINASAMAIFEQEGIALLQNFLHHARLNSTSDMDILPNYLEVEEARAEFMEHTPSKDVTAGKIFRVESGRFQIPQNEMQTWLSDIDIILLQHGNMTARNRKLISIIRLIFQIVLQKTGKISALAARLQLESKLPDIARDVSTDVLERLAILDPQKSRSNYLITLIRTTALRFLHQYEMVLIPHHLHEIIGFISRHPLGIEVPDKEIRDHYKRKLSDETIREAKDLLRKAPLEWMDRPLNDESDSDVEDFLPELRIPSFEADVIQHETQARLAKAMSLLPALDQILLRARFDDSDTTLQEVGNSMGGLSRERVRQMQADDVLNLMGIEINRNDRKRRKIPEDPEGQYLKGVSYNVNYIISADSEFADWCNLEKLTKTERQVLILHFGLEEKICYRRLKVPEIQQYLRDEGHHMSLKQIRTFLDHYLNKIRKIPPEERFLTIVPRRDFIREAGEAFHELHLETLR